MSHLDIAFKTLCDHPTIDVLTCFAAQIEMLAPRTPDDELKPYIMNVLRTILRETKFEHIREDEAILRVYKVLGSLSQKLGATGVYEQLNNIGYFEKSLKFHLQWAEEYGKSNNLPMFEKVLDLARKRLKDTMTNAKIEAGFRDLAENYFKTDVDYLFIDRDETLNLFDPRVIGKTKNRRRSSVCMLRRACPAPTAVDNLANQNLFGPKTKTLIRRELVEGISCEEFRVALINDAVGDEMDVVGDEMDISKSPEQVQNPKIENRRRQLSMVAEEKNTSDEADSEKRSRIFSPIVPTKDANRVPLRNSSVINEQPQTITLSSDTRVSQLENQTFEIEKEDEKLKEMELGRKERYCSDSERSTRTAKSDSGLDIIAENNCLEAHAAFSDTVHIARERTVIIEDHTMMENMESLAPTQSDDYSVFCDPDPTFVQPTNIPIAPPSNRSSGLNMRYDSVAPTEEEMPKEKETEKLVEKEDASFNTPPIKNAKQFFDESILSGFQQHGQIVTSTPANHLPFVHVEDYFGNSHNIDKPPKEPVEETKFVIPEVKGTLQHRLNRRKSVAPTAVVQEQCVEQKPSISKPSMEESLSEQLGKRLSLGKEELSNKLVESTPIEEETGKKERRRSEIIRQEHNPWDVNLRIRMMKCVHTPINMHEFETISPKIVAMKSFEAGGEKYDIRTLLGQGGYAKVYKAVNEEKKLVAVKYEIPSCAWEVYICDQMRTRLLKRNDDESTNILNNCIMQVTDAYIFTNASLLVNEYHEYGNLLDNINNSKDPNWHISCFLLVQLAKIIQKVHECQIVHGDIKPDNFMITRKIDLNWKTESLMGSDVFVVKLIDWGRAIDMEKLSGREFKGRAGTEGFDCPEMIDGRSWTYQPDYFGFAATMAVMISGTYSKVTGSQLGSYSLDVEIKRRNTLRDPAMEIIDEFLNIPSCTTLPNWSKSIDRLEEVWKSKFDISSWRQAATKFNESCEKSKK